MTLEDLDKLDALADAATQGKRTVTYDDYKDELWAKLTEIHVESKPCGKILIGVVSRVNAEFIAALDPATVKQLVTLAREALERRHDLAAFHRTKTDARRDHIPEAGELLDQMAAENQAAGLYDNPHNPLIRDHVADAGKPITDHSASAGNMVNPLGVSSHQCHACQSYLIHTPHGEAAHVCCNAVCNQYGQAKKIDAHAVHPGDDDAD